MTQQTQQFAYRWLVVTVCISFGALCLAVIASIFYFGDGEGIRIISDLQNYVIAGYVSLLGGLFGHQVLASKIGPLLPASALVGAGGMLGGTSDDSSEPGTATSPAAPSETPAAPNASMPVQLPATAQPAMGA